MLKKQLSPETDSISGSSSNAAGDSFEQMLEQQVQFAMQLDQLSESQSANSAASLSSGASAAGIDDILDKICAVYNRIQGSGFLMAILKKLPVVGILLQLLDGLCAARGNR